MKKLVYTLSFVVLASLAGNAQSKEMPVPQDPTKKEARTTDSPPPAVVVPANPTEQPKSRMAITQKGVPASKTKEPAKETKPTDAKPTTEKH